MREAHTGGMKAGGAREFAVVFVIALLGLVVAAAAVLTPWTAVTAKRSEIQSNTGQRPSEVEILRIGQP